jgi:hypothetical protein
MNRTMPAIDLDAILPPLSAEDRALAARSLNKGRLRASKPPIDSTTGPGPRGGTVRIPGLDSGRAAYLWRMVAFNVSPHPRHHCMPVCAEFDLPGEGADRRRLVEELDALADRIVNAVPRDQWHGVIRWGNAPGMIGAPRVAPDGAIVYRGA